MAAVIRCDQIKLQFLRVTRRMWKSSEIMSTRETVWMVLAKK
jgi:hypothetical protein